MDFAKLNQNEKLAVYGSAALIVGGVAGYSYGLTALGILAAIAMLVVVFLPQLSSTTTLPGSRGSLMVAVGGVAGAAMALALLSALGSLLDNTNFRDIAFLVAVVGGLLMAWAGWQEFQSEGGKFQLGTSSSSASASPASAPTATAPSEPASTAAQTEPVADEQPAPEMAEAPPVASEPVPPPSEPARPAPHAAPAPTEPVDAPTEDPLREDDRPAT